MSSSSPKLDAHIAALKALKSKTVEAGWFESARYPATGDSKVGESVARNARWQDQGTGTIPARPFMRFAAVLFSQQRNTIQSKLAQKLLDGKISPDQALAQIGMAMEACIVDSIKSGNWTPNAPSTIKAKGFDKPLVDSAVMLQTVTSTVT